MPRDEPTTVPFWEPADTTADDPIARASWNEVANSNSTTAPGGADDDVGRRVDALATTLRDLVLHERDAVARQAWAEANAWAEQQVAAEASRLREEADARVAAEVERATSHLEQTFESRFESQVEEIVAERLDAAVELIVPQRAEAALADLEAEYSRTVSDLRSRLAAQADAHAVVLADAARAHALELQQVKARAEEMLAHRYYDHLTTPSSLAVPTVAPSGLGPDEARAGEHEAVLAEIDRLRRGMSRLDDARTLSEILDALSDTLRTQVDRLAVTKVTDTDVLLWQSHGFEPDLDGQAVRLAANRPGVLARVIETGVPCFVQPSDGDGDDDLGFARLPSSAAGFVAPVLVDEHVIALVYADGPGAPDTSYRTWPEVVGVLTKHAGRCLDALSALMRATGSAPSADATAFAHRFVDDEAVTEIVEDGGSDVASPADRRAADRRTSARTSAGHLPWLGGITMLPGHDVSLVNLSDDGALFETASKLAPGSSVLLQFIGPEGQRVSGEVLRCAVFTFSDGRTAKYRGAVKFSEPLSRFFERAAQSTQRLASVAGVIDLEPVDAENAHPVSAQ